MLCKIPDMTICPNQWLISQGQKRILDTMNDDFRRTTYIYRPFAEHGAKAVLMPPHFLATDFQDNTLDVLDKVGRRLRNAVSRKRTRHSHIHGTAHSTTQPAFSPFLIFKIVGIAGFTL